MKNLMTYKNYTGSVEYSDTDKMLFGQVVGIKSLISYQGRSVDELRADFEDAVDDYLDMCEQQGVEPEVYYKGAVSVRMDPELHRLASIAAQSNHETLNEFIRNCIRDKVSH